MENSSINNIYLPSIVFGWAVKIAGSKMKRVLSTTKVIRSSLAGVLPELDPPFCWFLAGPKE